MEYVYLGDTKIKVSRICVECMSFGDSEGRFHKWTLPYEETKKMIQHALSLGINFFDTANTYSEGTSEEYLGRALKELGVKREDVVIASKVYFNEGHLSKEAIFREIDGTLERLQTTYLDLYQIHRFDYDTPMEETMEALHELVKMGKVKAIGASAMYGYQFHNMQEIALKHNWTPFSTMQNHYNLLYREDERELIPVCKQFNVTLIPYSPLAGGHLSHVSWESDSLRSQTDQTIRKKYDHAKKQDLEIITSVKEIADKKGVSMSQIALAWILSKGANPIVGSTKPHHYDEAVKALEIQLTEEEISLLEQFYLPHQVVGALPER
ncbi:MAG: aldo/keto reductase [Anaeroplasmataceae bacterium]|nr:aldo/keto reductase [Anaeroplasmataceae bacterium]